MQRFLCLIVMTLLCAGCGGLTVEFPGQGVVDGQLRANPNRDDSEPASEPEPINEVLFFTQPNCPPCERDKPKVEELRQKGVKITEINIREQPDLARQYRITRTPTYVVLENGVEIQRTQSISALIIILVKLLAFLLPLMLG